MNSANEIAHQIRNGQLTAEKVMEHFIKHARKATEKTNCVTVFIKEALQEAQDLDKQIAAGTSFPESGFPLLGVPISIKDSFNIKGYPAVSGYKANIDYKCEEDATIIKLIRDCGGIPFCKTNVCQFMWTFESSNPIYDTTGNPIDSNYTSGGSTSGEAPLIKLGGSILGLGSDTGGSLRVPAHFCGAYTLKPTPQRIPGQDCSSANITQEPFKISVGPVANNVKDLKLFMKSLLDKQCWKYDELGIPVPFREFKLTKPLKVGYIVSDGMFPASPACQRAVLQVVKCLKSVGHEVFKFNFSELSQARIIGQKLLTADQLTGALGKLRGEGIDDTISSFVKLTTLPNLFKKPLSYFLQLCGQKIASETVSSGCRLTLEEMWQVQAQRSQFRQNFQSQWQEQQLDVLIMPPLATPAFKHGHFLDIFPSISYSLLASILDLPSGVLPVTHVSPQDKVTRDWLINQLPTSVKPEYLHKKLYENASTNVPLPVGIQVLGMRFDDEKVLAIMELIDNLLHSTVPSNLKES